MDVILNVFFEKEIREDMIAHITYRIQFLIRLGQHTLILAAVLANRLAAVRTIMFLLTLLDMNLPQRLMA